MSMCATPVYVNGAVRPTRVSCSMRNALAATTADAGASSVICPHLLKDGVSTEGLSMLANSVLRAGAANAAAMKEQSMVTWVAARRMIWKKPAVGLLLSSLQGIKRNAAQRRMISNLVLSFRQGM